MGELKLCKVRRTEIADAPLVLQWENDPALWTFTEDSGPFTITDIKEFLSRSTNLETDSQERWIIESHAGNPVGCVDIFEYDRKHSMAGIGVVIPDPKNRRKGYAFEAIKMLKAYLYQEHKVHILTCMIYPDNLFSIGLFEKLGFKKMGQRLFKDRTVFVYQCILAP